MSKKDKALKNFSSEDLLEALTFLAQVDYSKIDPHLVNKTNLSKLRIAKELVSRGVIFWEEVE